MKSTPYLSLYRWFFVLIFPFLMHASLEIPKIKKTKKQGVHCSHNISKSFTFGDSSCLPQKLFLELKDLNLLHLITLSGIHLGILISLIPWRKKFNVFILILLAMSTFFFENYFAVKRMIWMKLLGVYLDPFLSFALVFAFDFSLGSFNISPLSHLYSYIFLIILMTSNSKNQLKLCFEMMLAFCLIAGLTHDKLYPLSFLANFIMIPIFNLIFPIFIFNSIYPIEPLKNISENIFNWAISITHELVTFIPSIKVSDFLIILALVVLLKVPKKYLIVVMIILPLKLQPHPISLNYKANILEIKTIKPVNWAKKKERIIAPLI